MQIIQDSNILINSAIVGIDASQNISKLNHDQNYVAFHNTLYRTVYSRQVQLNVYGKNIISH